MKAATDSKILTVPNLIVGALFAFLITVSAIALVGAVDAPPPETMAIGRVSASQVRYRSMTIRAKADGLDRT